MARAQGARAQMVLAFETTYGTPPASGFTRMPFASTTLGAEQPLLASELLGYGRDPLAPIKDALTADEGADAGQAIAGSSHADRASGQGRDSAHDGHGHAPRRLLPDDARVVNGGVKLGHGAAQNWATLGLRG